MSIVSNKEAMRLTGKSHATIYRYLKNGKLSRTVEGIDTAELLRVFGPFVSDDTKSETSTSVADMYQKENSDTQTKMLQEQIQMLKGQLSDTKNQLERSQMKEDKLFQMLENRLPAPDENSVVNRLKKKFL
jgi:septal ring factor EnvC (AmiA/AmiB activator)